MGNTEAITPFSYAGFGSYLERIPYAKAWYAVRDICIIPYAYASFGRKKRTNEILRSLSRCATTGDGMYEEKIPNTNEHPFLGPSTSVFLQPCQ